MTKHSQKKKSKDRTFTEEKMQRPNKIKIENKRNEIKECIEKIEKTKKQILNRLSHLKMKWASLEKKN